jgi:hypothetical protein
MVGGLLTESVQVIQALQHVSLFPYATGISIAKEWLAHDPDRISVEDYMVCTNKLLMITPSHPDANWWYANLKQYQ